MVANLCLRTATGLKFYSVDSLNVKELAEAIRQLKQQRKEGKPYIFVVTLNDDLGEHQVTCEDVLVDFRELIS